MKNKLRFEYDITDYCNLNCAGCSHYAPIGEGKYVTKEKAQEELNRLSAVIQEDCDIIHIMGGEPLLNPQIKEILKVMRTCFPMTELQIVTNGLLLGSMEPAFWKACHDLNIKICLTIYPIPLKMDKIMTFAKMFQVDVLSFRNGKYFCRYLLDEKGKQDIEKSYDECSLKNCPIYHDFQLFSCTTAGCVHKLNRYFQKNFEITEQDYLAIDENTTKEMIFDFLDHPVSFCRYCKMDEWKKNYQWSVSNKDSKEWIYEE